MVTNYFSRICLWLLLEGQLCYYLEHSNTAIILKALPLVAIANFRELFLADPTVSGSFSC